MDMNDIIARLKNGEDAQAIADEMAKSLNDAVKQVEKETKQADRKTALAQEIAESAPLAVMSTRETMRRGFADGAEAATERELTEQDWTRKTEDFKEGVKSYAEKRPGNWKNR